MAGRRPKKSDEFDHAVILACCAMLMLRTYHADASALPGSPAVLSGHELPLNPGPAFTDGFGMYFAAVVKDDPVLLNSRGFVGSATLVFDLEQPTLVDAGPFDSLAVAAALWDLSDSAAEAHDGLSLGFTQIWNDTLNSSDNAALPGTLDLVDVVSTLAGTDPALQAGAIDILNHHEIDLFKHADPLPVPTGPVSEVLDASKKGLLGGERIFSQTYELTVTGSPIHSLHVNITGAPRGTPRNRVGLVVQIFDATGSFVTERRLRGLGSHSIDVSSLPAGTYFVELGSVDASRRGVVPLGAIFELTEVGT